MNKKLLDDKKITALFQVDDLTEIEMKKILSRKTSILFLRIAAILTITFGAFLIISLKLNNNQTTINSGCKPDTFYVMMIKKSVTEFNSYREKNPNAEIVLCNANLQNMNLQNINLNGLILDNADFRGSNLTNANLENTKADNIRLEKSIMLGASLRKAVITNSKLQGSNLRKANLTSITLQNSNLKKANLNETKIDSAVISDVEFKESILKNASFYGSRTLNSDFSNTDAKDILYDESRFESCDFSESSFPANYDSDTIRFKQCKF